MSEQFSFGGLDRDLVVDNFAGGGGASTGIEAALGRPVDIAVNHDPVALAMHQANHPGTLHLCENITEVDPAAVCAGRPVGLAWFSPDCTHFSVAKGGKPRKQSIRGLAWVVIRWAKTVRPRVIILENVREFRTWGPLLADGRPDKARAGQTFRAWTKALSDLGYTLEHRTLVAADYGAPTTRKRLFLVARCDGAPIVWPQSTHEQLGAGASRWRPAASIIDWSLRCPSIFERKRPLKPATLRRIAAGIRRYVIECAQPFIIPVTHPRDSRVHDINEPLRTVTAANRGELALVAPSLIQTGYGERVGQAPRALDLSAPLGTVVAGGAKHGLVAALLSKHYTGVVGQTVRRTLGTVTAVDHHSLTTVRLETGDHAEDVRALLAEHGSPTAVATVRGDTYAITDIGMRMLQPHELFAAQGFPSDYSIRPLRPDGKPVTKTQQIALAGNSVCPPVAEALVRANALASAKRAAS